LKTTRDDRPHAKQRGGKLERRNKKQGRKESCGDGERLER
jgi:hypothetical protein